MALHFPGIKETVKLISSWGYSWQTLVSAYAIIPLAYYVLKQNSPANFITSTKYAEERQILHKWLQIALLKRIFGGTPDSVLRPIRKAIQENPGNYPYKGIQEALQGSTKSMKFDLPELEALLDYRYDQPYTFSALTFLYPWLKYDQQFHVDHIFPKSKFNSKELTKHNIPPDQWTSWMDHYNDIANLQLLQGPVNIAKSDQYFDSWLANECKTEEQLTQYKHNHFIPNCSLKFEDFPTFLEKREKLIKTQLAKELDVKLEE